MQIGIRLHDVNTGLDANERTLEARARKAREEGFSCVHLALQKVISGMAFDEGTMTEGLAAYVRRVFAKNDLDIAVLGCYFNLANPDPLQLEAIKSKYYAHLRVAPLMGAAMVGTETGAPNVEYKLDANTHSQEALDTFMRNLEDVVAEAERRGATVAIEPVWNHIVYNADRAVQVLKGIGSRNLRIILDPVNLLCLENIDDRDSVIADAIDKLGERVAMIHLKDFIVREGKLVSVAAGTGNMDYTRILRFMKERKPFIQATLENTDNTTAVPARRMLQELYDKL